MEWSEFLNTDTVKLTVIPGILVLLVLIFWFKRSGKKRSKIMREFGRAPNSRHDNLDWATAVSEADQEVRLGQAYDLDVLGDEILSVNNTSRAKHPADERDPTLSDIDDAVLYTAKKKFSRHDDEIDFLEEVELIYKEPPRENSPKERARVRAVDNKHDPRPQQSESIVYSYEESDAVSENTILDETEVAGAIDEVPAETEQQEKEGLILVLNVVGAAGRQFRGSAVLKALTATGLTFGAMNIFHYYHLNRPGKPMFSIANMVEPGSFTLATMEELTTPGLTLFANVSRPEEGISTFTIMLESAKKLASILDAEVCDERRGTLSKQGVEHIHGQIREHQRRSRLAHAAARA